MALSAKVVGTERAIRVDFLPEGLETSPAPSGKAGVDDVIENRPKLVGNTRLELVARVSGQSGLPEKYLLVGLPRDGEETLIANRGPLSAHVDAQPAKDAKFKSSLDFGLPLVHVAQILC